MFLAALMVSVIVCASVSAVVYVIGWRIAERRRQPRSRARGDDDVWVYEGDVRRCRR